MFFELTTRPLVYPPVPAMPLAFGALARWQAVEVQLAAHTPVFYTNPFTGRPFSGILPAPKGLYAAVSIIADALHRQRSITAVVATLLLLIPAIALVRGGVSEGTEGEKRAVSLMVLLGPGTSFVSTPGTDPLLVFARAAAFYVLERRRPLWQILGAILAPLTDPAGLLVVPACLAAPREKRPLGILAGIAGAAGLAALVGNMLFIEHHAPSIALEPLRTWMSWPGGQLGQVGLMLAGRGPRRAFLIHAFLAAIFVIGGLALA